MSPLDQSSEANRFDLSKSFASSHGRWTVDRDKSKSLLNVSILFSRRFLRCVMLFALALAIASSSGCFQSPEEEEVAEEPAFEFDRLQAMPDLTVEATTDQSDASAAPNTLQVRDIVNSAKPGHWIAARQRMVAKESDFQGTMRSLVLSSGQNALLETSSHFLVVERPMLLQTGSPKDVELIFYIPRRLDLDSRSVLLEHTLVDRLGRSVAQNSGSVSLMEPHQYFTVVLSNSPDEFSFLLNMRSHQTLVGANPTSLDNVVLADCSSQVPLPTDVFGWTAISTILWHDLAPDRLDPAQQQAMLDWLHFGGQLICSGPDCVENLRGSFLGPYLAARSLGSVELAEEDFSEVSQFWSLPLEEGQLPKPWRLVEGGTILGADLELLEASRFVPNCGEMLADRRVGKGRVVVSAFSLTERSWRIWPSVDNFLHNALYLRPRRDYVRYEELMGTVDSRLAFVDYPGLELNPLVYSKLRFFSHDWRDKLDSPWLTRNVALSARAAEVGADQDWSQRLSWHEGTYTDSIKSGVAGWNDMGAVSRVARRILTESSGLEPPSRAFVMTAVGIYLFILVPLNWLVFRLLNRVEWAWIAAPLIAIIAAIVVVRAARLDIGFARSQSELAIVEVPAGYDRAHVTRYSNLYTSLSTRFAVDFDSSAARGVPWGARNDDRDSANQGEVVLNREGNLRLEDFRISSNTAGLLHSEEFLGIGGPLTWAFMPPATGSSPEEVERTLKGELVNASELQIRESAVVHRDDQGNWWGVSLTEVSPNQRVSVELQLLDTEEKWDEIWAASPATDYLGKELAPLLELADADRSGSLSLAELDEFDQAQPSWISAFGRVELPDSQRERDSLPKEFWPELCREIAASRFSNGGFLELWMSVARKSGSGTYFLGTLESLDETCHVEPLPSQRSQSALLIADLSPAELPSPQNDLRLPFRANGNAGSIELDEMLDDEEDSAQGDETETEDESAQGEDASDGAM